MKKGAGWAGAGLGLLLLAALAAGRSCGGPDRIAAAPPAAPVAVAPAEPDLPLPPALPQAPPPAEAPPVLPPPAPAVPIKMPRGRIHGTIRLGGERPPLRTIRMDADPACRAAHEEPPPAEDLVVGPNGELAWAFVYVRKGHQGVPFPPTSSKPAVQLIGCRSTPRVVGVRLDEPVVFVSRDYTPHFLRGLPIYNPPFAADLRRPGAEARQDFIVPEVMVRVGCDVHPWERAWVGALDHPFFAVTGPDGSYRIAGLPSGTYEVAVWHEKTPVESAEVALWFDDEARQDFELRLAAGER